MNVSHQMLKMLPIRVTCWLGMEWPIEEFICQATDCVRIPPSFTGVSISQADACFSFLLEEMAQKHGIEAKQLFENLAARDMVLLIEVCSAVADFGLLMPCASLYLGVFESAINAGLSVRLVLGATHCSHPPRHLCCRWVRF